MGEATKTVPYVMDARKTYGFTSAAARRATPTTRRAGHRTSARGRPRRDPRRPRPLPRRDHADAAGLRRRQGRGRARLRHRPARRDRRAAAARGQDRRARDGRADRADQPLPHDAARAPTSAPRARSGGRWAATPTSPPCAAPASGPSRPSRRSPSRRNAGIVAEVEPFPKTSSRRDRAGRHPGAGRDGTAGAPAPRGQSGDPLPSQPSPARRRRDARPGDAGRRAVALTRFEGGELLPLRIFHLNVDAGEPDVSITQSVSRRSSASTRPARRHRVAGGPGRDPHRAHHQPDRAPQGAQKDFASRRGLLMMVGQRRRLLDYLRRRRSRATSG